MSECDEILLAACDIDDLIDKLDLDQPDKLKKYNLDKIKSKLTVLAAEKWHADRKNSVDLAQTLYILSKTTNVTSQLYYYCSPLEGIEKKTIIKSPLSDFSLMNSSIFFQDGRTKILCRAVNYKVDRGIYTLGSDGSIHTKHVVFDYLESQKSQGRHDGQHDGQHEGQHAVRYHVVGNGTPLKNEVIRYGNSVFRGLFEDMRIIPKPFKENTWKFLCSRVTPSGVKQYIGEFRFDDDEYVVTDLALVKYGGRVEKNWIPIKVLDGGITMCCYMISPLEIIYVDEIGEITDSYIKTQNIRGEFWGGSNFCSVPGTEDFMCIVHEYGSKNDREGDRERHYRTYYNRFLRLDRNYMIKSVSNLFRVNEGADIEYVMSLDIRNGNVIFCLGLEDRECQIIEMALVNVEKIMWDACEAYSRLYRITRKLLK